MHRIPGYEAINQEHGMSEARRSGHLWFCELCYQRYVVDDHHPCVREQ